jgi:N-methylhydantoinase B/oxoprolinase/acetone carboxylase alpha subunit
MATTDPFTLEVIQSTIDAITDEMFAAMRRAAYSTVIYEVLDFGVAIADAQGDLASQGSGIPIFIGMLDPGFRAVVRQFAQAQAIEPGDIFICNDPWAGGASHLNDVSLIMPVFMGEALVAWTACKGHWSDIGGMVAGSVGMDAVEVFQEGLRLPLIKLFEAGKPVNAVLEIIRANSRLPDAILGDMWAGVSAVRLGARRIEELASTYGADALGHAFHAYQQYGESVSLNALKQLPKGTFRAVASLEALGDIQVNVGITDEEFVVDLRGNPQPRGGRGVLLEYRLLSRGWTTGIFTPNFLTRPWSMDGGGSGSSNRVVIRRLDGREEIFGKFSNVPLEPGDIVRVITGHGGGWGDPAKRAIEDIERDLENEFITDAQAHAAYGYTRGAR